MSLNLVDCVNNLNNHRLLTNPELAIKIQNILGSTINFSDTINKISTLTASATEYLNETKIKNDAFVKQIEQDVKDVTNNINKITSSPVSDVFSNLNNEFKDLFGNNTDGHGLNNMSTQIDSLS
jgi:replicative DNA helicase